MKNPEIVKQAIAALRDNADSDFERHRIDVLERDLIQGAPPVEIVDEHRQRFNETVYRVDNSGHYTLSSKGLHRALYEYHYGNIPEGYIIHHIDGNPANNDISNLQALTPAEHRAIHKTIQPRICDYCGKEFLNHHPNVRFCSNSCSVKARWATKRLQPRKCEWCGKEFQPYGKKSRFCSQHCAGKAQHDIQPKHCEWCDKEFVPRPSKQRFCSRSCAAKACRNKSR